MAAPRKTAARKPKVRVIPSLMQVVSVQPYEGDVRLVTVGAADFIAWQRRYSKDSAGDLIRNPFDLEGWGYVVFHALAREGEVTEDAEGKAFEAWAATIGSIIIGDVLDEGDAEGGA